MSFLTEHQARLETFSRFSKALGQRADYVQGGGGNTSVKLDDRLMAIKASGFLLSDIQPDAAYAVLDYQQLRAWYQAQDPAALPDVEAAGSAKAKELTQQIPQIKALRPSVEAGFHALLKRYVAHTHSVWANLLACSPQAERLMAEAMQGLDCGYAILPYVDPGARLTFTMRDALREAEARQGKEPAVLLMLNHGPIVHHEDADTCLQLHEEVNRRFAALFGLGFEDFPEGRLKALGDQHFTSDTPYLWERLKGDRYSDSLLLDEPLYPDQMVFFRGTLGDSMRIDRQTGIADYRMGRQAAQALEDTLCAVLFIREQMAKKGMKALSMGEAAQAFIGSWESEAYRKGLAEGKA